MKGWNGAPVERFKTSGITAPNKGCHVIPTNTADFPQSKFTYACRIRNIVLLPEKPPKSVSILAEERALPISGPVTSKPKREVNV